MKPNPEPTPNRINRQSQGMAMVAQIFPGNLLDIASLEQMDQAGILVGDPQIPGGDILSRNKPAAL